MRRRYLNELRNSPYIEFDDIDEIRPNVYILKKDFNRDIGVEVYCDLPKGQGYLIVSLSGRFTINNLMCNPELAQNVLDFCSAICPTGSPNKIDIDLIDTIINRDYYS